MIKYGVLTDIKTENREGMDMILGQVKMDEEKVAYYPLVASLGIDWKPSIGDKVQVIIDSRGDAVVCGVFITSEITDEQNIVIRNYRDTSEDIIEFQDKDKTPRVRFRKNGNCGFGAAQADPQKPIHTSEIRIDNTGASPAAPLLNIPTPVEVAGGDQTQVLGRPSGWLIINIGGIDRKVPFY